MLINRNPDCSGLFNKGLGVGYIAVASFMAIDLGKNSSFGSCKVISAIAAI